MNKKLVLLFLPLLLLGACNGNSSTNNTSSEESSSGINYDEHIHIEETTQYLTEQKIIYRDGLKIAGELYIPENSQDVYPLLIMSHGFNQNMDDLKDNAHRFNKKGYATFVYDFIGGGSSIKSDGKLTDMSVLTEAKDLNTVIDYFKDDERFSKNHTFLFGQSQGGFVSTYVAGTRNDIRGLLDYYPAFCIKDDALAEYKDAEQVPDPYYMKKMNVTLGKIFYTDITSFDIYEVMKDVKCETLLAHGTSDNIVPLSYAQRAAETIPNCTYLEIKGAGHGFSGADATKAINACFDLLSKNL